jgi:hypothetical protein
VPRHIARLVTRLVSPLVVDYYPSRRLVVDYFASAARPGASAHRAARQLVSPLVVDYSDSRRLVVDYFASAARPGASARHATRQLVSPLVVDYSASRRLVVDYFASAVHPGASARRVAHHAARRAARRRQIGLALARRRLLRLRCASGCLGTSRDSSRGLSCPLSSTTPCRTRSRRLLRLRLVRVPRHVAWLITRLVAPLVVDNSASR